MDDRVDHVMYHRKERPVSRKEFEALRKQVEELELKLLRIWTGNNEDER